MQGDSIQCRTAVDSASCVALQATALAAAWQVPCTLRRVPSALSLAPQLMDAA